MDKGGGNAQTFCNFFSPHRHWRIRTSVSFRARRVTLFGRRLFRIPFEINHRRLWFLPVFAGDVVEFAHNQLYDRIKNPPDGGLAVHLQFTDPIPKAYPKNWQTLSANRNFETRLSGFQSVSAIVHGEHGFRAGALFLKGAL